MFHIYQISDSPPVLPAPKASSITDRQGSGRQEIALPKKSKAKGKEFGAHARVNAIPTGVCSLFKDPQTMLMMLELFGITSRICQELGSEGSKFIPYLSLLSAPTYLYHASQRSYTRFKLMIDAVKIKNLSDTIFWAGRGLDSFGTAVGNVSKSISGGIQICTGTLVLGLFLTHVLPTILVVVGAIGGLAQMGALWRSASALKRFESEIKSKPLHEALNYLAGPQERVHKEDADADTAAAARFRASENLKKNNFITSHYTSENRYNLLQQKINFSNYAKSKVTPQYIEEAENSAKQGLQECIAKISQASDICTDLVVKPDDIEKNLEHILSLYSQVEDLLKKDDPLRGMVQENKEKMLHDLLMIRAAGGQEELIDLARSEIHRNMLYCALFIIMTLLMVADGTLALTAPDLKKLIGMMGIASSLLDIGWVIFDKSVTQEQYLKLEKMMGIIKEKDLKPRGGASA